MPVHARAIAHVSGNSMIQGLLLTLTNFCFRGAVLFRASLRKSKKESKAVLLEMFKFPLNSDINNQKL